MKNYGFVKYLFVVLVFLEYWEGKPTLLFRWEWSELLLEIEVILRPEKTEYFGGNLQEEIVTLSESWMLSSLVVVDKISVRMHYQKGKRNSWTNFFWTNILKHSFALVHKGSK